MEIKNEESKKQKRSREVAERKNAEADGAEFARQLKLKDQEEAIRKKDEERKIETRTREAAEREHIQAAAAQADAEAMGTQFARQLKLQDEEEKIAAQEENKKIKATQRMEAQVAAQELRAAEKAAELELVETVKRWWLYRFYYSGNNAYNLLTAIAYSKGLGVSQNKKLAAKHYHDTADFEIERTTSRLTRAASECWLDKSDYFQEQLQIQYRFRIKAAANYSLGLAYANGDGVAQNLVEAASRFRSAANVQYHPNPGPSPLNVELPKASDFPREITEA